MQLDFIKTLVITIRILLFFSGLISLAALAWSAEFRNNISNILEFILIFIVMYFVFSSLWSANMKVYIVLNIIGLLVSLFLIYETIYLYDHSPFLYYFNFICFVVLILIKRIYTISSDM